jgi:hypothetical protein
MADSTDGVPEIQIKFINIPKSIRIKERFHLVVLYPKPLEGSTFYYNLDVIYPTERRMTHHPYLAASETTPFYDANTGGNDVIRDLVILELPPGYYRFMITTASGVGYSPVFQLKDAGHPPNGVN